MAFTVINGENKELLAKTPKYIIKFFATWCGPCKLLAPIVKDVAQEVDVPFFEINIDEEATKDIVHKYTIQSVPQLIYVIDGQEVARKQGFIPKGQLLAFVNSK